MILSRKDCVFLVIIAVSGTLSGILIDPIIGLAVWCYILGMVQGVELEKKELSE